MPAFKISARGGGGGGGGEGAWGAVAYSLDDACLYSAEAGAGCVFVRCFTVVALECGRVGLELDVWGACERRVATGSVRRRGGNDGGPGAWLAGGGAVLVEAYVYLLWVVEVGGGMGEAVVRDAVKGGGGDSLTDRGLFRVGDALRVLG